jgi:Rrf2 family protein
MRLSRAGEYAIRCILNLSQKGQGVLVTRKTVADEMDIPHQFLSKIAQQLARAGLIEIVQGARGGFKLALPSDQISLLDVLEAVIGEIFLNDCILRPDSCHRSPQCAVHQVWQAAVLDLRQTLRSARFSDLIQNTCQSVDHPQQKGD